MTGRACLVLLTGFLPVAILPTTGDAQCVGGGQSAYNLILDSYERHKNDEPLCNLYGVERLAQAYAEHVIEDYGFEYAVHIYPSRVVSALDMAITWSHNDPSDSRTPPSCIRAFERLVTKVRAHAEQQVASHCGSCPPENVAASKGLQGCSRPSCDERLENAEGRLPQCASQICSGRAVEPTSADFCEGFEESVRNVIDHPSAAECRQQGEDLISNYERLREGPDFGPGGIEGGNTLNTPWMSPAPRGPNPQDAPPPPGIGSGVGGSVASELLRAAQREVSRHGARRQIREAIRRDQACTFAREGTFSPDDGNGGTLYRNSIEVVDRNGARSTQHRATTPLGRRGSFDEGVANDRDQLDRRPGMHPGPTAGGTVVVVYTWVPNQ